MNFLQRTPFFRLLVALIAGIVTARYLVLFTPTLIAFAALSVIAMTVSVVLRKSPNQFRIRWLFGVGLVMLLFLSGYSLARNKEKSTSFSSSTNSSVWMGEISTAPQIKEKTVACNVLLKYAADSAHMPCKGKNVLLYIQKNTDALALRKGDIIIFQALVQSQGKPLNPKGFDFARWLSRKGIAATGFVDSVRWRKVNHVSRFSLSDYAGSLRQRMLSLYERFITGKDEFAVLSALTLGYKEAIDPELRETYSDSGAMHILAVSGLHVGVIYLVLSSFLSILFRGKYAIILKAASIVILLWAYAFITGLPPSVIRSVTMFSLVAIGSALDRKAQIYNTISVSAFLILISDTDYLYDIGFQLSYAAVISIVYFQPYFAGMIGSRYKVICWLRDLAAVSLAAQIGTLPLAIYYFNQFPNYFLLTNFLVIPLATLIIYATVVFITISWIPVLSVWVAFALEMLLKALNESVAFIQQIPGSVSLFYMNDFQLWMLVLLIFGVAFYIETRKYLSVVVVLFATLCLVFVDFYQVYVYRQKQSLAVYADRNATHVNLIDGRSHIVITTNSEAAHKTAKAFWRSRRLHEPYIDEITDNYTRVFNDKRILVLQTDMLSRTKTNIRLDVDYLILGNGTTTSPRDILNAVNPKKIIADLTIPEWYARRLADSCYVRGINFYYLKDQGAYLSDFHPTKR